MQYTNNERCDITKTSLAKECTVFVNLVLNINTNNRVTKVNWECHLKPKNLHDDRVVRSSAKPVRYDLFTVV